MEKYFHLGYDYETITDLLQAYHSITMSVCTLKLVPTGSTVVSKYCFVSSVMLSP